MLKHFHKGFESEIEALKSDDPGTALNPLRQAQIKQNVLEQIQNTPQYTGLSAVRKFIEENSTPFVRYGFAVLVLFTISGIGTIQAAEKAMPGDRLYGLKLSAEKIQFTLALTQEARADLQTHIIETRLAERQHVEANMQSSNNERLNNAIETLSTVQVKLEEKGNTQAAESVKNNIQRFKDRAAEIEANIKVKAESSNSEPQDHGANGQVRGQSDDKPSNDNRKNKTLNFNFDLDDLGL